MATGCYTPRYLTGSFRGVPFRALDVESEHGRRGAEGEFPFGEETAYADLGRKIRTYKIRARFDSNEHVLEAAALIAVCEIRGPSVLVHPTRGVILSAACRRLVVSDKVEEEQGVTYVDMEFVEANNQFNGLSLGGQLLGLAVSPLLTATRASFSSSYQMGTIQSFREDAVVDAAQAQVAGISERYAIATQVSDPDGDARNRIIADFARVSTDNIVARNTDNMDRALALGMGALSQVTSGQDKFEAFRVLANNAALTSTFSSPASEAENSIYALVRIGAAAYMAEGVLESETLRSGQIFEQADIVDALLEAEMLLARDLCDNCLYEALAEFRTDAATQLAAKAYTTPGLVGFNYGGSVHPLKAAYDIHDDAKRHREIEAQNVLDGFGRSASPVLANVL